MARKTMHASYVYVVQVGYDAEQSVLTNLFCHAVHGALQWLLST